MNRVAASIIWAAVALGCTAEDPVSTNEQALSCKPKAPFCDAKMPDAPPWKQGEQAPQVNPKTSYAILIDLDNGQYLAALSDLKQGQVVWARTLDKSQLGAFIDTSNLNVAIDIVRPPPRPPVGPGGGDWNQYGYFSLEYSARARLVSQQASDALENY